MAKSKTGKAESKKERLAKDESASRTLRPQDIGVVHIDIRVGGGGGGTAMARTVVHTGGVTISYDDDSKDPVSVYDSDMNPTSADPVHDFPRSRA